MTPTLCTAPEAAQLKISNYRKSCVTALKFVCNNNKLDSITLSFADCASWWFADEFGSFLPTWGEGMERLLTLILRELCILFICFILLWHLIGLFSFFSVKSNQEYHKKNACVLACFLLNYVNFQPTWSNCTHSWKIWHGSRICPGQCKLHLLH